MVDNAVKTVEIRLHDAILTAIDNVVTSRFELAVRFYHQFTRARNRRLTPKPRQKGLYLENKKQSRQLGIQPVPFKRLLGHKR